VTRVKPTAGKGINGAFLGTARRRDGRQQVVYHSHPLYYYSDGRKPGDVQSQGMVGFWWTLTPKGLEIK
jgi:predicted lipoprotein with Yx(FWY)xxD motif